MRRLATWACLVAAILSFAGTAKGDSVKIQFDVDDDLSFILVTPGFGAPNVAVIGNAISNTLADDDTDEDVEQNTKLQFNSTTGALTTTVVGASSSSFSTIVPGTFAVGLAGVDPSGSGVNPLPNGDFDVAIATSVLNAGFAFANPFTNRKTNADFDSRATDPIVIGTNGFGGRAVPAGSTFTWDVKLAGAGQLAVDGGGADELGTIVSRQFVLAGAVFDPSQLNPGDLTSLSSLMVAGTTASTAIQFTPGSSTSLFDIHVSQDTAAIEANVLSYLNGASDVPLFTVSVTTKVDLDNITLGIFGEATGHASAVPEPSSLFQLSLGAMVLIGVVRAGVCTGPARRGIRPHD
jgi:hypothetical protein